MEISADREMVKNGEFLEHATFSGNLYGTRWVQEVYQFSKKILRIFSNFWNEKKLLSALQDKFSFCTRLFYSKRTVLEIENSGKICVLDIELQGVRNIKNSHLDARYILIRAPSIKLLEERLRARGTETEETLKNRLKHAEEDLVESEFFFHMNAKI